MTRRLLLFCEYTSLNGGERSLLSVLRPILQHPFEVVVALPRQGDLVESLRQLDVPTIPFDFHASDGIRQRQPELRQQLWALIADVQPDLVHANSLATSRLAGPVVQDLHCPSLGHLRDIIGISRAALEDLACHTRLAAVSQATKHWYVEAGLASNRISVLHNGVDLQRFRPRPSSGILHRQLDLPPTAEIVGAIGQIGVRKGLDVLLDAMVEVVAEDPACHLAVIGKRHSAKAEAVEYERRLLRRAEEAPLRGHVHFLGERMDVHDLLPEFCFLAHAARQEPLGRVLLEGAAAGVAIVATDVGGTTDIFPPGAGAAVLVKPADHEALAGAISRLLSVPEERIRLGQAARKRAEECFGSADAAQRLLEIYEELAVI